MYKLNHEFKDELVLDATIARKSAHPNNLQKQNVSSAILVFSDQVASALKVNYIEEATGTCEFLEFIDNIMMKPFATVSCRKGFIKRDPFCSPFLMLLTKD